MTEVVPLSLKNSEAGPVSVVKLGPLNNSEVGPLSLNKVTQMVSTTRPRISIKYHLLQFMIITTIKGF